MHAAYDAHNEASLLCAVHEGHQDLAAFLCVTNTLHLLQEEKRVCGPRREGVRATWMVIIKESLWKVGGAGPVLVQSALQTADTPDSREEQMMKSQGAQS